MPYEFTGRYVFGAPMPLVDEESTPPRTERAAAPPKETPPADEAPAGR